MSGDSEGGKKLLRLEQARGELKAVRKVVFVLMSLAVTSNTSKLVFTLLRLV